MKTLENTFQKVIDFFASIISCAVANADSVRKTEHNKSSIRGQHGCCNVHTPAYVIVFFQHYVTLEGVEEETSTDSKQAQDKPSSHCSQYVDR